MPEVVESIASEVGPPKPKKVLKLKKLLNAPQPTTYTKATEAFEAISLYYAEKGEQVPQSDIAWYIDELEREKKELAEFWETCSVTKATLDSIFRGDDLDTMDMETAKAKLVEKKEPLTEFSIGPMPAYGTREFWSWCFKRKQLRLEKEAAIIAAGGTVPVKKTKAKAAKVSAKGEAETKSQTQGVAP